MKTPRIEELIEDFKDKFGVTYIGQETQDEWLRNAFTKAYERGKKAGIDEAVDVVKNLPTWILEPTDPLLNWKKGQNEALERVLQALQDK